MPAALDDAPMIAGLSSVSSRASLPLQLKANADGPK
jgi:hypothetical protein